MNKAVKILRNLLWAVCLGASLTARSQEPVLTLQAPSTVTVGQTFEVRYAINVSGSKNFQAPAFKGLDVLYGPAQSQSSSFSFVNGRQSHSFELSFTYRLRAPREGNFQFGKASITVDGQTLYSEPFNLQVTAAPQGHAQNQQPQQRSPQNQPAGSQTQNISGDDLYIRAVPSKRNPYVGEQIIITYRIYTSLPVDQYSIYKTPSNKGFWCEEMKVNPQNQQQEVINNKAYIWADVRKAALFAQESGKLQLDPMEVEAVVQVRSSRNRRRNFFDFFDDDFFAPVEYVKRNLHSQAVQINAKPLPAEGRPLSFDGLVGSYKVSFGYDQSQPLKTNEAVTLTFKVSGRGNIEMIHAPQIQFPHDFEVYEPKISHEKTVNDNGVSGSATFEYIVVPRSPGVYKIPAFDYSFFNPATGRYEEIHTEETVLDIAPGKDMPAPGVAPGGGPANNDIAPIQTGVATWKKPVKPLLFSLRFWLVLLGELLSFAAAVFSLKQYRKKRADIAGIKNRKAAKEAKKCLRKAAKFLKENKREEFHIEISQALWGFLSNKLNIPTAELSMENVRGRLEEKQLDGTLVNRFITVLDRCEFARFAPDGSDNSMQRLYDDSYDILYKIAHTL